MNGKLMKAGRDNGEEKGSTKTKMRKKNLKPLKQVFQQQCLSQNT